MAHNISSNAFEIGNPNANAFTALAGGGRNIKTNDNYNRLGYTYDATTNGMLQGRLKGRLDRVLVYSNSRRGKGAMVTAAKVVGTEALVGVTYTKRREKRSGEVWFSEHPVLPSDHYGLVVDVDLLSLLP
jgi:hypothetical protein